MSFCLSLANAILIIINHFTFDFNFISFWFSLFFLFGSFFLFRSNLFNARPVEQRSVLTHKMKHDFCQLSINEVVVNDVDQIESFFTFLKEIDGLLIACFDSVFVNFDLVDGGPDVDEAVESFVLPKFESLVVDDGRLDNFSAFENAPCYSVDVGGVDVLKCVFF